MIELLPDLAIIGTTLFMMAVGTLWYSDIFLGKRWLLVAKLSPEDIAVQKKHLTQNTVGTFVSYALIISTTVALSFVLQKSDISPLYAGLAVWLVIVAVQIQSVLWEARSWWHVIITGGFYALLVNGGLLMVTSWPW